MKGMVRVLFVILFLVCSTMGLKAQKLVEETALKSAKSSLSKPDLAPPPVKIRPIGITVQSPMPPVNDIPWPTVKSSTPPALPKLLHIAPPEPANPNQGYMPGRADAPQGTPSQSVVAKKIKSFPPIKPIAPAPKIKKIKPPKPR
ncbi:hypothetical protein FUAX_26940 [Fulvitalea axinellae]|uniref:Uncharacterized protein n=1 Tax=Fulvitalea axinellae TaxID=1182444 RepID=A0AAU9CTB0_9BACT|nr:hypothetical protein FUAX_26940 [Fulvitalea axinellae]